MWYDSILYTCYGNGFVVGTRGGEEHDSGGGRHQKRGEEGSAPTPCSAGRDSHPGQHHPSLGEHAQQPVVQVLGAENGLFCCSMLVLIGDF